MESCLESNTLSNYVVSRIKIIIDNKMHAFPIDKDHYWVVQTSSAIKKNLSTVFKRQSEIDLTSNSLVKIEKPVSHILNMITRFYPQVRAFLHVSLYKVTNVKPILNKLKSSGVNQYESLYISTARTGMMKLFSQNIQAWILSITNIDRAEMT